MAPHRNVETVNVKPARTPTTVHKIAKVRLAHAQVYATHLSRLVNANVTYSANNSTIAARITLNYA
jgi:hypothetical protein